MNHAAFDRLRLAAVAAVMAVASAGAALLAGCDAASPAGAEVAAGGCGDACAARVAIPAGTLPMGCGESSQETCLALGDYAVPVHAVEVPAFAIDRYETTVGRYRACVDAGGCEAPTFDSRYCNWSKAGRDEHPMNCVDWDQARAFCAFDGGRLCTEAEWEWAARGAEGRRYPWGSATPTCERAVMNEGGYGCGTDSTAPVGTRPGGATPEGVLDLAGNVWEWLEDTYVGDNELDYDGAPTDGSAWVDPAFRDRIVRGGGFPNVAKFLIAWRRHDLDRSNASAYYVGLRCCRSQ